MSGYGLKAINCESVKVTNCSFYHSVFCLNSPSGGGVVFSMENILTIVANVHWSLTTLT